MRMNRMFNNGRSIDGEAGRIHALRLVLLAALDRDDALRCLEGEGAAALCRWPSGIYAALGHAAFASPRIWGRCQARLDAVLAGQLAEHGAASPAQIAERFHEGRDALSSLELAGMLWSLLRRQELHGEALLLRLSAEFEVAVFAGSIADARPSTPGRLAAH